MHFLSIRPSFQFPSVCPSIRPSIHSPIHHPVLMHPTLHIYTSFRCTIPCSADSWEIIRIRTCHHMRCDNDQ